MSSIGRSTKSGQNGYRRWRRLTFCGDETEKETEGWVHGCVAAVPLVSLRGRDRQFADEADWHLNDDMEEVFQGLLAAL